MIKPYTDMDGKYLGKWRGKLKAPPKGEYPSRRGKGICHNCKEKASRTPYFLETNLPGYKLRFCWCRCGEKWTEIRKLHVEGGSV
ncbi:MAG: hypothetical protein IJP89_02680 [Synergistaceae bacterium]|nr:hypothetical protein [Synergistaceae bacterium]